MKLQQPNMGFTLIELMVVLAVMTVLLTLAIPAMTEVMASSKLANVRLGAWACFCSSRAR